VRSRFGVDAVRYQRGTDAVAGTITDEKLRWFWSPNYEGEVAANGMHGMIEGVDAHGAPDQGSGARLFWTRAARRRSSSISIWRFWSFTLAVRSSSSARTCSEMSVKVAILNLAPEF